MRDQTGESDIIGTSEKRTDYLSWNDYFMAVASLPAHRSKDPSTQVGACIVDEDKRIVGIGYNGMPDGCSDDKMPWGEDPQKTKLETKRLYVCHAEMNAVVKKTAADIKGCTMYVTHFPCNECAKVIIQSGLSEVVYLFEKNEGTDEVKASRRMLETACVKVRKFSPDGPKQIVINFE